MEREFPHLGDTAFPHLSNVDVWKYRNNFDYGRWEDNARIKMCSVNWDSGYVNVVEWKTDAARDSYFDSLSGYKVDEPTMFQVQPDGSVKVPVPFNSATQYNYIVLEYPTMPTAANPLENAAPARHRYYYFCEALEELAPSTTLCHVSLDVWTTYINSVSVSGMMLARGHAPMAKTSAEAYLANPRANCTYLEAPDVSYGGFERSNNAGSVIYNGDVWAVVSMTSDVKSSVWGSKEANTWQTPTDAFCGDSSPRAHAIAVEPSNLESFINSIITNTPQAMQTIKAVWFAPKSLVNTGHTFTFAGVTVRELVLKTRQTTQLVKLTKGLFGYDSRYADMAKLYTYPYARLMVSDHNGGTVEIRIEETDGTVSAVSALDFVAPFIAITTQLTGIGGASSTVTFANISSHTATIAGNAYSTLRTWNIPTFEVYMSAAKVNDYATHFDRAQANTALQNAYTSATASAKTAYDNGINSVDLSIANLATSVSAALAVLAESQDMENTVLRNTIEVNNILTNNANLLTQTITNAQNEVAAISNMNNVNAAVQSGQLALGVGAGQGIAQAVSMDFAGALNTAASNFQYAFNQSTSMQANTANVGIAISTREEITSATKQSNSARNTEGNQLNLINTRRKQRAEKTNLNTETTSQTTQNNRSAEANKANMQRGYNTNVANAGRSRSTALSAIENGIKQAALDAPMQAGSVSDAAKADTMPLGWFAWVETQGRGAIESAAAQFARYGYQLNQYWDFDGWQLMESFTYWQCDDVWVVPRECSQATAALIRSVLIEGTTVWREPAIIGATSVWEN